MLTIILNLIRNRAMMTAEENPINLSKFLVKLMIFAVVYFITARLGLLLATLNQSVSPVWPATGVAFSILLLSGMNYWPAILLGAFGANFLNAGPLTSTLFIAMGNTLQGAVGVSIVKLILKKEEKIGPHTRTLAIVIAAFCGGLVSATIGSLALTLTNLSSWDLFQTVWTTWFTGDSLGVISFLPLVLSFSKNYSSDYKKPNPLASTVLFLALVGLFICWLLFIRPEGSPFLFFIFPYLIWCATKGGERGVFLATVLLSLIGIVSIKFGYGVFTHGDINSNLINLQLFLASVGISALMMADLKRASAIKQSAMVLAVGWLLAGLFFFGFYLRSVNESNKHFKTIIEGVEPMLEARINLYFTALQSGIGLFAASEEVTRKEWKIFLDSGQLKNHIPAASGLGVIFRVPKNEVSSFIQKAQKSGAPKMSYKWPEGLSSEEKNKAKELSESYLVTYIEPQKENEKKLGLDMASEKIRKTAADLARDTGEPTITKQMALLDDPKKRSAFLIFYPFYQNGTNPNTVDVRRKYLKGWIYAPILSDEFFNSVFTVGYFKELSYNVYGEDNGHSHFIVQSPDFKKLPQGHEVQENIKVANRIFRFYFKRSGAFYSRKDTFSSWAGAISSIITLLLSTFIVSIQSVKKQALELAALKTRDLKSSEELLTFALQGAGDSAWDWDIVNAKVSFTNNFEKILGYSVKELNDQGVWRKRIHPEDLPMVTEKVRAHLEQRAKNFVAEFRIKCSDEKFIWLLSRGMIVKRDEQSLPLRMVGTISDITSWKEAEAALNSQREKLMAQAKLSSLGEMAGGIAHEINNPLAIIIGKTTQLKRKLKNQSEDIVSNDLSVIENTSKRISSIIKGLSAFSRNAENDKMEKVLVPTLIQDTLELSRERFRFHSIHIKFDPDSCEKIYVLGRASQLLQVLINLLNNAYDAVENLSEKWVEINVSSHKGICTISVTDSGNGIPPAILEKMATPFFTTKPIGKGTGLGLSISKSIVEEHRGKLYYDGSSSHTRFVIELPIA
ncbi:MAG: CHASE domain-containing protein [Bacteriovorax sp.]